MARKKQEKVDYTGKSIKDVLSDIKKIHGKDSIRLMDQEDNDGEVEVISTGSMWVDSALGINGLPRGRVVEILGPESGGKTTLALHCVSEAQKAGGVALYIDAEHAMDMSFAKKIGVNASKFVLCQPDSGEQALDILEKAVSSGKFAIAVVDSVSALVPQAEIDGSVGDSHMGLQARLMGQGLRKITSAVSKTKTLVIFINQIRMKIGVMFGCFHEDTLVTFSNGSIHRIRDVVEKRLAGPVISFDPMTRTFKSKKITNWFENGTLQLDKKETWYNFVVSSAGGRGGKIGFSCTPEHKILPWGSNAYVPANTLKRGDTLTSWYESKYLEDPTVKSVIFGSLLGDGTLRLRKDATASFSIANQEQPEYLRWKLKMLKTIPMRKSGNSSRPRYDSEYRTEFAVLREKFYSIGSKYRGVPERLRITPQIAAIWYMDDGTYKPSHESGSISVKRFFRDNSMDQLENMVDQLNRLCSANDVCIRRTQKVIAITTSTFRKFCKLIYKFVPVCMQYKLLPEYRTGVDPSMTVTQECAKPKLKPYPVKVISVDTTSKRKLRSKHKYDIEVARSSNYLVGGGNRGVVVHNSPETTSGGQALKFFSSIRIDIRRIGALKEKERVIGNKVRVKIIKNKLASPYKEIETDLIFGYGFSKEAELLQMADDLEVVDIHGSTYSFGKTVIGRGRLIAVAALQKNKDLFDNILAEVRIQQASGKVSKKEQENDDEA